MEINKKFKSSISITNAISLAFTLSSIVLIILGVNGFIPDKYAYTLDAILTAVSFYIILCFWLKKLTFDNDSIEIYYYIRPFAKRYQYQYKNIVKVFYDSGLDSYFIFTVQRKHPWWIFKKKRYIFA